MRGDDGVDGVDYPHRVWWLGYWPSADATHWWLTCRLIDESGAAGPVGEPLHGVIDAADLSVGLKLLTRGLIRRAIDETSRSVDPVAAAWAGTLATPEAEELMSITLGRALIPPILRAMLTAENWSLEDGRTRQTVVIAAGPNLAGVPFELLMVDELTSRRLIEMARVRGGLHAAAFVGARAVDTTLTGGALRVLDPGPSSEAAARRGVEYGHEVPPIYPAALGGLDERWFDRTGPGDVLLNPVENELPVTREVLSQAMRAGPKRLLFLGHAVSGQPETPARAGLVLADPVAGGPFRPFTAAEWITEPDRWPAPSRVAIMSCHSNDTHLFEQMGLVQAAFYAGACLVTSTRWVIPADRGDATVTTELALAVDRAHDSSDPITALRRWQLDRLDQWRRRPGPESAPLIWASPVTYQRPPATS